MPGMIVNILQPEPYISPQQSKFVMFRDAATKHEGILNFKMMAVHMVLLWKHYEVAHAEANNHFALMDRLVQSGSQEQLDDRLALEALHMFADAI